MLLLTLFCRARELNDDDGAGKTFQYILAHYRTCTDRIPDTKFNPDSGTHIYANLQASWYVNTNGYADAHPTPRGYGVDPCR